MILAACPACNTGNRVGDGDPSLAKCGRCGGKLFTAAPIDVDDEGFAAHVKLSSMPVLVDVWAPWCGPCRMMSPAYADAARKSGPNVRFLKLNADDTRTPARLGVRGVPTFILFFEGKEVTRRAGMMPIGQFEAWLNASLGSISQLETYV